MIIIIMFIIIIIIIIITDTSNMERYCCILYWYATGASLDGHEDGLYYRFHLHHSYLISISISDKEPLESIE